MKMAISEAISAFGNGAVFIEKYASGPRHIEIQLIADNHGNCVYLFERECSIQRRHQKVIEEAPSSVLTPELRKRMGECAVAVAKACNYSGAGTVEFLVDDQLNFYFLEMNTRLQVEHPVSEYITGLDLVKEQIKVARNEKLSFTQDDLKINGHSIEVRVCAEDPANNFLPDIGKLEVYKTPSGPGVRVDDGFEEGMDIPIFYDPMIAKLVVHGKDRKDAIDKMLRAIADYKIIGVETTLDFCTFVLKHEAFVSGKFDTGFIAKYFTPDVLNNGSTANDEALAIVSSFIFASQKKQNTASNAASVKKSKWRENRVK
jgi:acetyl-CoA carboxylase biotin carboxylase subunit